jgi:TolB-like protein
MGFAAELKRRNVFKVGIGYVVAAWLLLQVVDVVVPLLSLPDWVGRFFFLLLAVGFPIALIFAWAFELTPEGLRKEKDVKREESISHVTGRKLDFAIIALLVVAVIYFGWDNFFDSATDEAQIDAGVSAETSPAADSNDLDSKSIAVLPFADLSEAQDQRWFADGLAEEILNSLARTPDLQVASRTSSFRFRDSELAIEEMAAEMGVAHVLEGSVRATDERLRVTAQLIRASDGFHLWSENYDRDRGDMISVQEDLARNIATALETTMDPAALEAMTAVGTQSVEAYQAYLRGMVLHSRAWAVPDGWSPFRQAYEQFELARELDNGFAWAHFMAARYWLDQMEPGSLFLDIAQHTDGGPESSFHERIDQAIDASGNTTDRLLFEGLKAKAQLRLRKSLQLMRQYVAERPNDDEGWLQYGWVGQMSYDQATIRESLDRLQKLGANDSSYANSFVNDAWPHMDPSIPADYGLAALSRWPDHGDLLFQTHRSLLWAGRTDEARVILDRYLNMHGGMQLNPVLRQACAEGDREAAEERLELLLGMGEDWRFDWWLGSLLLGNEQRAYEYLKPIEEQDYLFGLATMMYYPYFDHTRYPELVAMLEREGIDRPPVRAIPFACP